MKPSLGTLEIDLPNLLETRMLVQANSGGGKSWCVRRIIEQTAAGVQQIVIDPEGEFATLREKFDYIVCAPHGGDAVANPSTAAALARALWESGASAIVDIYDLKRHERTAFVRLFLESLVNAPRTIWHPTLLVIDEIQLFAPEGSQSESLQAVIDVATRGRKRGLALLGATLRLGDLSKSVAAELNNKLIGRTGLDVDVTRAAYELGISKKEAFERLRGLSPGDFYAFGPSLCPEVQLTHIGPVKTSHPKSGQRLMVAPPPASKSILAKLSKIEGLQRDTAEEMQTSAELKAELAKVRRELASKPAPAPAGISPQEVDRRLRESAAAGFQQGISAGRAELAKALEEMIRLASKALGATPATPALVAVHASKPPVRETKEAIPATKPAPRASTAPVSAYSGVSLKSAEQRLVDAIAWWAAAGVPEPSRHQVAFVAGYTVNGHFNNQAGALKGRGLVEYPGGGTLTLTAEGAAAANAPDARPTRDDLIRRVTAVLKGEPMRRVFAALVNNGRPMARAELAGACGYTENGHFNNIVGALTGVGVAEYPSRGLVGLTSIFEMP